MLFFRVDVNELYIERSWEQTFTTIDDQRVKVKLKTIKQGNDTEICIYYRTHVPECYKAVECKITYGLRYGIHPVEGLSGKVSHRFTNNNYYSTSAYKFTEDTADLLTQYAVNNVLTFYVQLDEYTICNDNDRMLQEIHRILNISDQINLLQENQELRNTNSLLTVDNLMLVHQNHKLEEENNELRELGPLPPLPSSPIPIPLREQISCMEVDELLELRNEINDKLYRLQCCKVCLVNQATVVFLPCRHNCMCLACSDKYAHEDHPNCPVCRTPWTDKLPTII